MRDALEPSKVSGLSAVREDGLGKEDRMEGPVRRIDAGGLRLDRSRRTIPLYDLQRNVRRKPVRGSVDGAAMGLVAGAAAGLLAGYATYDSSSPIASSAAGDGAAVAATFGVLGIPIGGLIGWLTTHDRTYEIRVDADSGIAVTP
jgi:hypothetical protein